MARDADNFISETFWTTDERFCFQKVGRCYNLYDRKIGYSFLRDFRSFKAMQDFLNEERRKDEERKRNVRSQEVSA